MAPPNKPFAQESGGMQPKSRPNYSKLGLLNSTTHYDTQIVVVHFV